MFWTPQKNQQLRDWVHRVNPRSAAEWNQNPCGTSGKACGVQWSRIKQADVPRKPSAAVTPPDAVTEPDNLVSPLGPKALSEQEMLALFQVDTTRWEPNKLSHNIWEQGAKGPDGELLTQPLCQTTLTLKRIEGAEGLVALGREILSDVRDAAPPKGPFVLVKVKGTYCQEIDPMDLHLGKLGWKPETESSDYDITIAMRDAQAAADDLFAKTAAFDLAEVVIPFGNDEQHTDNARSETTSGTRVDSDSRFHKMFREAVRWRIWLIRRSLQRAPLVHALTVPGNHDFLGAFTVGEVVRAYFTNEPRVRFDNEPPTRKYHRFGNTLLGYTHGSEEKHTDLPLIMATERPHDWAETVFHEWRLGHLHTKRMTRFLAIQSHGGVGLRVIQSLSGTDAWHAKKGYIGNRRAMESFIHHIEEGEVGAFISRLPQI